jgi:hypothetical protein
MISSNSKNIIVTPLKEAKISFDIDDGVDITFSGTGNDDLACTLNDATTEDTYHVSIDGTDNSKFRWYGGEQSSWSDPITITAGLQELDGKVSIQFASASGHVVADNWTIEIFSAADVLSDLKSESEWSLVPEMGGIRARAVAYTFKINLIPAQKNIQDMSGLVYKLQNHKITGFELTLENPNREASAPYAKIIIPETTIAEYDQTCEIKQNGPFVDAHFIIEGVFSIDIIKKLRSESFFKQYNWNF